MTLHVFATLFNFGMVYMYLEKLEYGFETSIDMVAIFANHIESAISTLNRSPVTDKVPKFNFLMWL